MQVSVESSSGLERRMKVQLPAEQVDQALDRRFKELARTMRMNGFRPGKVPLSVVKRQYGGQVRSEIYGELIRTSFSDAVRQQSLKVAGEPQIEGLDDAPDEGFSYTAVFEVMPDISLASLDDVVIKRPVVAVADEDVEAMIEKLRRQRTAWEPVERPCQDRDQVVISFKGTLDGELFDGGSAEKVPLVLGSGRMIEGFESGLIGAVQGESRGLDLAFPADYRVETLAGKPVHFEVEVLEIKEPRLPGLDEAFAKAFGVEDGNLETLRSDVRANMDRELRQKVSALMKNRVMDALFERNPLDVPKAMVAREAEQLKQQAKAEMASSGRPSTLDLPADIFADQAKRRVALGLLVGEILRQSGMKADPDRVRATVEDLASSYEQGEEVVRWYYGNKEQMAAVENLVIEDQVVDWVLGQCRVEDEPSSFSQLMGPTA